MSKLEDKIILVTGATSGIGEVAARELAKQGAHVVLLGRNAEKAAKTQQDIKAAAGHDRVDVVLADLSVQQQVRDVAATINAKYPRLDVLVNNAGLIFGKEREVSVDGHEMTLATNHLGPFLLTSLLFGQLQQSPAARIVNVASMAYRYAKPSLLNLELKHDYSGMRAYANSKLFNIMFTQELARRMRTRGIRNVATNSLHPGFVASSFGTQTGGLTSLLIRLLQPFTISTEKGAETSIFLASDPQVEGVSGGYFAKKKAVAVKHPFNTLEHGRRLWEVSEEFTSTSFL